MFVAIATFLLLTIPAAAPLDLELTLRAEPDQPAAGSRAPINIVVTLPEGVDAPVRLATNVGELDAPRRVDARTFSAWLRPPAAASGPALAVIAAAAPTATGVLGGALIIKLPSLAEVIVDTQPWAWVDLWVDTTHYGRVRTSAAGRAEFSIPVLVPTFTYRYRITLRSGDVLERTETMAGLQTSARLTLVGLPAVVRPGETWELVVAAASEAGAPVDLTALTCWSSSGTPVERVRTEGTHALLRWYAAGALGSRVELRCTHPDAGQGSASAAVADSLARQLVIDVPPTYVAGGPAPQVHILALDGTGAPVTPPPDVVVTATRDVDAERSDAAVYPVPSNGVLALPIASYYAGASRLHIDAHSPATGLRARAEIELRPGPPHRISIGALPATLVVRPRTEITLRPMVHDQYGNPVLADIAARARHGVAHATAAGELAYTPRAYLTGETQETLELRAGEVVQVEQLVLLPARRLKVAAHAGLLTTQHGAMTSLVGVAAWAQRGAWGLRASLDGGLGWERWDTTAQGAVHKTTWLVFGRTGATYSLALTKSWLGTGELGGGVLGLLQARQLRAGPEAQPTTTDKTWVPALAASFAVEGALLAMDWSVRVQGFYTPAFPQIPAILGMALLVGVNYSVWSPDE